MPKKYINLKSFRSNLIFRKSSNVLDLLLSAMQLCFRMWNNEKRKKEPKKYFSGLKIVKNF